MTDFLYKPNDDLTKRKVEVTKSLKDRLQRFKTSIKHTLLIDLSGSMFDIMDGGESKRNVVENIVRKLPEGVKKFAFSGHVEKIENNQFPDMGGSTRMHEAFQEMHRQGIDEIILLTDGLPDDEARALDAAKGLKIEIIYIGPMPRPDFLERLAHKTNGHFTSVDVLESGAAGELENVIKGLLSA